MVYEIKLGHNIVETTKNICCAKGEGAVDHSIVSRWFKKFCSDCKNLNNQTKSGTFKTMDSKTVHQAIGTNQSELGILQTNVGLHL